jgi:universal stress protein A
MSVYKHILFAIDHDDNGASILKSMIDFADNFNAKVSLVHVVGSFSASYAHADTMLIDEKIEQEIEGNARKYLNYIAKSADFPIENSYILNGDATKSILKYAEINGCDLIVVNGHNHNIIGKIWSVTEKLMNAPKVDVVVLKSLGQLV